MLEHVVVAEMIVAAAAAVATDACLADSIVAAAIGTSEDLEIAAETWKRLH